MIDNAPAQVKGVRGRDLKKLDVRGAWKDPKIVYEFEDGWTIAYLDDAADTATLGTLMGHCAGAHFVWTCEERIWYFFALLDPQGVPHSTIHAKQASWVNKPHPRDKCPVMPVNHPGWGGYPSLDDVKQLFKDKGLVYEPGKYKPLDYNSVTYDRQAEAKVVAGGLEAVCYPAGLLNRGRKLPDIDEDVWSEYVKAYKAVEDNYRKNSGAVQLSGRRFKFDGKWLILLTASHKSQGNVNGTHGKKVAEWLNSIGKKEKK